MASSNLFAAPNRRLRALAAAARLFRQDATFAWSAIRSEKVISPSNRIAASSWSLRERDIKARSDTGAR